MFLTIQKYSLILFVLLFCKSDTGYGNDSFCNSPGENAVVCCCGEQTEIEVPGGDFEFGPAPAPGGWIDYTDAVGPWDVSFGSISHHDDGHNNLGAGNPNPSTAHLDINGFSAGGICQTIGGFTVGQECTIVFYYAIHNAISSGSASLQIDGGAALDIVWDADNPGNVIWLEASYSFIATNTDMDICFASEASIPCCGMLIDDITMFCCPPDEEDPQFNEEPSDEFYQCITDVPAPYEMEASDDCTEDLEILINEEETQIDDCRYTIIREWYVEDECGNSSTYSQLIEIEDLDPPVILSSPNDLYLSCSDNIELVFNDWLQNLGEAEVTDNCNEIIYYALYDEMPSDSCIEVPVIFVYSDACGHSVEDEAFVFFEDKDAPEIVLPASDLTVPCSENQDSLISQWLQNNGESVFMDDCEFEISHDFTGPVDSSQLVNFWAEDNCGNSTVVSALIIISHRVDTIIIDSTTCDINTAGVTEFFIDSDSACDSLIIFNIALLPSDTSLIFTTTCNPAEVLSDSIMFTNQWGCDSLVFTSVTLLSSDTTNLQFATCNPDLAETDTLYFFNQFNCDSLVIISNYLTQNDTIVQSSFSCDILEEEIQTYTIPGSICDTVILNIILPYQQDTLFNIFYECGLDNVEISELSIPGPVCDTVIIDTIYPLYADFIEVTEYSCRELETGIDTIRAINTSGCDSIIVTTTIYDPIDPEWIENESCYHSDVGSDTIIVLSTQCDSVYIINTVLINGNSNFLSVRSCDSAVPDNDTLSLQNVDGCDSVIVSTYYFEPIIFDITVENDPCLAYANGSIEILDVNGGVAPYLYSMNAGNFEATPDFDNLAEGEYTLQIMDAEGCMSDIQYLLIDGNEEIDIELTSSITLSSDYYAQINIAFSTQPDSFYWSHPELLSCADCLNPNVALEEEISLTLYAVNQYGCLFEKSIFIELDINRIYVPNIFSPNGDGVNDEFGLYASQPIRVKTFRIFDRWGNLVFEREDFSTADQIFWDGTFNNHYLNPDVFLYFIELEEELNFQTIYVGDITLIR